MPFSQIVKMSPEWVVRFSPFSGFTNRYRSFLTKTEENFPKFSSFVFTVDEKKIKLNEEFWRRCCGLLRHDPVLWKAYISYCHVLKRTKGVLQSELLPLNWLVNKQLVLHMFVRPSVYIYIYPCLSLSTYIYLYTRLFIYLSIYLSICHRHHHRHHNKHKFIVWRNENKITDSIQASFLIVDILKCLTHENLQPTLSTGLYSMSRHQTSHAQLQRLIWNNHNTKGKEKI